MLILFFYKHFSPWAFFGSTWRGKTYGFLVTEGVYFPEKYDRLSEMVPFAKIQVFWGRPEWTKGGNTSKMTFDYFQIQKWMLQTVKAENVDEKNGVICPVSVCLSWVMASKLSKKLISAGILSLWKQFTYMHLKVLITLFKKMLWFIGIWATVHEILAIKISKKMLTQQKFNKILQL